MNDYQLLNTLKLPADLKTLSKAKYPLLLEEIRDFITEAVTRNGGHLGPNLGVVEIILSCHIVFDLSKDRLIFDVGHQVYPHKILTGRHRDFAGLRKKKGLSGYPHQGESIYDIYRGGHASTAVSTALGIRCGFDATHRKDRFVIALVGDGSMTGGMSFEGLNHAGHLNKNLIIILNDNSMSISPTIGGLAKTFSNFRHNQFYTQFREGVIRNIKKIPRVGNRLESVVNYSLDEAARIVSPKQIFTVLGLDYLGPIDGNDVSAIKKALEKAKTVKNQPVLIHAVTQKGLGYKPEGRNGTPILGPHALSPAKKSSAPSPPSYSAAVVEILIKLAQKDKSIVTITAAMSEGTGLNKFQSEFPKRYYDVGICEAHAVGLSAGLITGGVKPIFAVYSTFLQRGFDQVFHDIVLQGNLPLFLCIDRAGLVGDDGPSHHGSYDIAYLRIFPGIVLMAPKDRDDLEILITDSLKLKKNAAIRYPRSLVPEFDFFTRYRTSKRDKLPFGKSEILKLGKSGICFYAYGSMVVEAALAEQALAARGIDVSLVNARFAKPIDTTTLKRLYQTHKVIMVLEEGIERGGLGSAVLEEVCLMRMKGSEILVRGLPDRLVEHASRQEQFRECGLDHESLVGWVEGYLGIKKTRLSGNAVVKRKAIKKQRRGKKQQRGE